MEISNLIKQKLDEYLEFDSSKLFVDKLVRVFGGSIRDIIANMDINDVDILTGSEANKILESILISNGYHHNDYLCGKDLTLMYNNIKVISEPRTFIKGNKVVQLIRPSLRNIDVKDVKFIHRKLYEENFYKLLSNVDLSCCGVSYDGKNLFENVSNAVSSCLSKTFLINYGYMYNENRIIHRKVKLMERGWKEVSDIRDFKIESILSDKDLHYIKEY